MLTRWFLRYRSVLTILILISMLAVPVWSLPGVRAQEAGNGSRSDRESPPPDPTPGVSAQAGHYGSSPFAPPEKNDSIFVVDVAPGLDTGCSFRGDGPLVFDIQIDRYPGDIQKLLANGLAGRTAVLRLPAYDIDYYGGGGYYNPERDRISINGQVVPTEYLTGDDSVWKLNAFNIPLTWINFPKPSNGGPITPARNTIQIDIDTANNEEVWCMAIDWAALSIEVPRPVLMVHGVLSSGATWNMWTNKLTTEVGLPSATINLGKVASIQSNASLISSKVAELKQQWGVDKINILAHSKGGIDSRHYVEGNNTVGKLVQLASPNAGSPLANAIQRGLIAGLGFVGTGIIDALAPAAYQMTTPYMGLYNRFHGPNPNTKYVSMAGDYRFGGWGIMDFFAQGFYGGRHDIIVPVWSVHALGYAEHLTYRSDGSNKQARHTSLTSSSAIYSRLLPYLTDRSGTTANAEALATMSDSLSTAATGEEMTEEPIATSPIVGSIRQGETKTHTLYMDGTGPNAFMLYYGTGELALTLTSPSGVHIDPSVATTNSNVDFDTFGDEDGVRHHIYGINNPEVGTWTLTVTAPTVVNDSGQEPYYLTGFLGNTAIRLQATTNQDAYRSGAPIIIQATLQGGLSGSNADATAKVVLPDNSFTTVPLADNGQGDDTTAADGIYTGRFSATSQPGLYRMLVTASGHAPTAFSRSAILFVPVSASTSQFNGAITGSGSDTDGDGLFNELKINVGLNITQATTYRMLGVLTDQAGAEIGTAQTSVALQPGTQTISLHFDGQRIFQHGIDGPYRLQVVRLAEESDATILPLDERTNAYTTVAYRHNQFQHPGIYVPGTGRDQGIDTNGNGRFDLLQVHMNLTVAMSDYYRWSGHLVDRNGNELGFVSGAGQLASGRNTIIFTFNGNAIGRNGVNGPYSLNDVLIYGRSSSAAIFHAYTTAAYAVSQFEGAPPSSPLVTQATASPSPNVAGWHKSDVQVILEATGGSLGIREITYSAIGAQEIPTTTVPGATAQIAITAEGMTTITFSASDNAGNQAPPRTITVKLDKTPPSVTYTGNARSYTVDQLVTITCTADDTANGSGVFATTCENVDAPAYTFPLGETTLSATAEDVAGNRGSRSTTFSVSVTYGSLCNLTGQFLAASKPQLTTSFCAKLSAAEAAAFRGDATAKAGAIDAYKNQLAAQSGKALTTSQVSTLTKLVDDL